MILYPGIRGGRASRTSRLAFMWDARDASLIARSGQVGVLAAEGTSTIGGVITPGTGPTTVQAGRAQPRFGSVGGVPMMDLTGSTAGQDVEVLKYPFALGPCSLTLLITFTPTWAMGANRSQSQFLFTLGDRSVAAGPVWRISRGGVTTGGTGGIEATGYAVRRNVLGSGLTHYITVQETAAMTAPLDLLVTYNHTTGLDSISLRAANGVTIGPNNSPDASEPNVGRWIGDVLGLGTDPQSRVGPPIRLHRCKLAIGVKTFTDMDSLW